MSFASTPLTSATREAATIYAAMELSSTKWLVAIQAPDTDKTSRHEVPAGDSDKLLALLKQARTRVKSEAETLPTVVTCYEAGRDGFWLHRVLQANGIDNHVLDPEPQGACGLCRADTAAAQQRRQEHRPGARQGRQAPCPVDHDGTGVALATLPARQRHEPVVPRPSGRGARPPATDQNRRDGPQAAGRAVALRHAGHRAGGCRDDRMIAGGPGFASHLQLHQPLGGKPQHLADDIGIGMPNCSRRSGR